MMGVIVLACGFSTISERRQQERLVLASQVQGKHCVWGDAAAGGSENRGSVKHGRCSAGCCTQSSDSYMRKEPCPPTASIEGATGTSCCPAEHWPSLQPGQGSGICACRVSLLGSAALRHRGTSRCTGKALFKIGLIYIESQTWVMMPGDCIKLFTFSSNLSEDLPRYLRMQQKCLLFLDLTSVLSSCKLQKGERHRVCIIF